MSDGSGGIPNFPGDLSDHLSRRVPEPPDRWSDRIRHSWLAYVMLALLLIAWITAVVVLVVYPISDLGPIFAIWAILVVLMPFCFYTRVLIWNTMAGRDPHTGKRTAAPDR